MNVEALFLFLILLLGLVLCSFLGGNCNNKEGFSQDNQTDSSGKLIHSLTSDNNSSSSNNSNDNNNLKKYSSNNNSNDNSNLNNYSSNNNSNDNNNLKKYSSISNSNDNDNNNLNNYSSNNNSNDNNNGNLKNYSSNNSNSSSNGDNYNHYSGSSTELTNGATFTESNGGTVVVKISSDGKQSLRVTPPNGGTPMTFTSKESMTTYSGENGSAVKFYGPNGQTAVVIKTNDGQQAVKITDSNNNSITYTSSGSAAVHSSESNTTYFGSTGSNIPSSSYNTAYEDNASAGSVTGPRGNTAGYVTGPQGNTVYGTNGNGNNNSYYGGSAGSVTGPQGNTAGYMTGPQGNTIYGANNANNPSYGDQYYSTLPPGIPKSQILPGQEDLYILKSQIVPPVCPACPVAAASTSYKDEEKCRPCPAPQRCPEPAFDCKKVPNYSAVNSSYLPIPVLNDFSTFGM
jgi:hypothetical protein